MTETEIATAAWHHRILKSSYHVASSRSKGLLILSGHAVAVGGWKFTACLILVPLAADKEIGIATGEIVIEYRSQ